LNKSHQQIANVLVRKNKFNDFQQKVGNDLRTVNEYYGFRKNSVEIIDIVDLFGKKIENIKED
jgi:hypothetical protein